MNLRYRTFTLIELILVVAIIAILAAVMVPVMTSARQKARVAKILLLTDILKNACIMYNSDTGRYAKEEAGSSGPATRGLTMDDGWSGWNGPYIERELVLSEVGFGRFDGVYNSLFGYDLNGDGLVEKTALSAGNEIILSFAWKNEARAVNDCLDKNIPGNWMVTGRVRFRLLGGGWPANLGTLFIYLIGGA